MSRNTPATISVLGIDIGKLATMSAARSCCAEVVARPGGDTVLP